MHPMITRALAEQHIDDLRRDAEAYRRTHTRRVDTHAGSSGRGPRRLRVRGWRRRVATA